MKSVKQERQIALSARRCSGISCRVCPELVRLRQILIPSEIELSKIHGVPSRLIFSYQRFVQRIGELVPVTFNGSKRWSTAQTGGLYACWPESRRGSPHPRVVKLRRSAS